MTPNSFTPSDALRLKLLREAAFVGDAHEIIYTVAEIDSDLTERHSLWFIDSASAGARPIGADITDVMAPSPSPDGKTLALVTEVEGTRQICLLPLDGGPLTPLTALPQGVSGRPVWAPDGRSIAFTAGPANPRDPSLPFRIDRVTYRFERVGYLDDVVTDIYVVDVASGTVRQLTDDRCMNADPRWSPDGTSLSYLVSFHPERMFKGLQALHVLSLEDGTSKPLIDDWGGVLRAVWCPDGERIAFLGHSGDGYLLTRKWDLWTIKVDSGRPECRTEHLLEGLGGGIQADSLSWELHLSATRIVVKGDVAYVSGQVGGDVYIHRVALSGAQHAERVVEKPGSSAYLADVSADGALLYIETSFTQPPDLVLDGRRVTDLNHELMSGLTPPDVRALSVTAADGLEIDAWALTPAGEDGPWPTVLYIHGGPYGAFGSTYMIDFQLLVAAGFAVVIHNFRGSRGYGSDFQAKIVGQWGPAGAIDHHAAVDEAIAAGIADPERLGVCGYSHGSFATCWLVGTSDRFKAAIAENGSTDWATKHGNTDWAYVVELEMGGTPLEIPDRYRKQSALTYAPNCRTPLLFVVGEDDLRCHPVESQQYYRVLKENGVPTEILRLPNSSHLGTWDGPVPARLAQNEALINWFRRYLLDEESLDEQVQTAGAPASVAMSAGPKTSS